MIHLFILMLISSCPDDWMPDDRSWEVSDNAVLSEFLSFSGVPNVIPSGKEDLSEFEYRAPGWFE